VAISDCEHSRGSAFLLGGSTCVNANSSPLDSDRVCYSVVARFSGNRGTRHNLAATGYRDPKRAGDHSKFGSGFIRGACRFRSVFCSRVCRGRRSGNNAGHGSGLHCPEPEEKSQRSWTKPQFVLGLVAAVVVLGVGLAVVASENSIKSQRIAKLEKQAAERPLDPATNTRVIRLVPSHEAASNTPAVVIGGGAAQLVDFKIDETRSAYKTFRITIDRIDQGRVAVLHNLVKDSNGHLRIALNSSALGPGNYQLAIEGLSWRGDPEPDSWVTIGIQR
jgi:hypothetical protein